MVITVPKSNRKRNISMFEAPTCAAHQTHSIRVVRGVVRASMVSALGGERRGCASILTRALE